jgi:hypothetical protein
VIALSEEGFVFDVSSLCAHFNRLQDGRHRRGKRYWLVVMLMLMVHPERGVPGEAVGTRHTRGDGGLSLLTSGRFGRDAEVETQDDAARSDI